MGERDQKQTVKYELPGSIWFMGWLFTLGFAELAFWQGVLALILWPYYLGITLA